VAARKIVATRCRVKMVGMSQPPQANTRPGEAGRSLPQAAATLDGSEASALGRTGLKLSPTREPRRAEHNRYAYKQRQYDLDLKRLHSGCPTSGVSLGCVTRELGEALQAELENSAGHAEVHTDHVAMTRPLTICETVPAVTVGFAKLRRLAWPSRGHY